VVNFDVARHLTARKENKAAHYNSTAQQILFTRRNKYKVIKLKLQPTSGRLPETEPTGHQCWLAAYDKFTNNWKKYFTNYNMDTHASYKNTNQITTTGLDLQRYGATDVIS